MPLAPRFLEAAMALTVAYLAVEILTSVEVMHLTWIVGILGVFHGLSVSGFPVPFSIGAAILQTLAVILLSWGARFLTSLWRRGFGWGLLIAGLSAFAEKVLRSATRL
jgi:hypothetical protein